MNWLKKTLRFGEKIKQLLKKRPSKSDFEKRFRGKFMGL